MLSDRFKLSYVNIATDSTNKKSSNQRIIIPHVKLKHMNYCHPLFNIRKDTKKCNSPIKSKIGNFQEFSEKIKEKSPLSNKEKNVLASFLISTKIVKTRNAFKLPSLSHSQTNIKTTLNTRRSIDEEDRTRNSSLNNKYNIFNVKSLTDDYNKYFEMRKLSNVLSNSVLKSVIKQKVDDDLSKIIQTENKACMCNINPLYQKYKTITKDYED